MDAYNGNGAKRAILGSLSLCQRVEWLPLPATGVYRSKATANFLPCFVVAEPSFHICQVSLPYCVTLTKIVSGVLRRRPFYDDYKLTSYELICYKCHNL